jgi:hypothetical protein
VIPPDHDGEYVVRMEDVLDVYQRPYDASAPVVCMDEMPVQLIKETRCRFLLGRGARAGSFTNTSGMERATSSRLSSRSQAGATLA